ncbi:MAG: ABC transporter ATP-binding protein [Cellulosilyticum sp.]|nr:ABC transporter ATP-binding protein [Cellulosilyticum sp.]
MAEYIIQTEGLCKKYNKQLVVNQVDMHIKKGQIYGLVGKNGAGKTTIMKMLTGLIHPTSGTIHILGQSFDNQIARVGDRIGNILETPAFFPYLSARDNLEYYRKQKGIPEKECVEELLRLVSLDNAGKKKFKTFSLGMKQRLGLAYALLGHPDLLILDEPTNGLDPQGIINFREIILKLVREKQMTVIISSHILGELSHLADMYGFINQGSLVEEISAEEIEERCKHHLLIKVNDAAKAATVLEEKLGTTQYEIIEQSYIKLFNYIENSDQVVETLVLSRISVYSIQEIKGNLEEYYMKVMGDEKYA